MFLLIGNWKMAPEKESQAVDLAKKTLAIARGYKKNATFIVCTPFVHLKAVSKIAKGTISLGAQNVSGSDTVAQTGNISASMLKEYGVSYCIVGHSENRALGENNEHVAQKIHMLLEKKITPIVCVGERSRDAQGWYLSEVKDQLEAIFSVVSEGNLKKIIIAYEPVWAIGAHAVREATALECEEMVIFIRKTLADHAGEKIASTIPIVYGGSVDEKNVSLYTASGKIQGLLIGRASLDSKKILALAKNSII